MRKFGQLCRSVVTLLPHPQVPMATPEAEPQGNAMSVRITAAGAVAIAFLTYLTAPVSACDERYIKKCEKASAAAAAASEEQAAPAARRRSGRVHVVRSHRVRHIHFAKRTRAPEFATRERVLTSAESRMTTAAPESSLARRFRGFIDPTPMAQNAFEALRKPHVVALNLEIPDALPADSAPAAAVPPVETQAPAAAAPAPRQERATPQPGMELASAESKPVTLPGPAPAKAASAAPAVATANTAAVPMPQAFVSAAAPQPDQPKPSGFPVHQLVIALCGALGVAGALRFVVGA
jgi:hypothetical protein